MATILAILPHLNLRLLPIHELCPVRYNRGVAGRRQQVDRWNIPHQLASVGQMREPEKRLRQKPVCLPLVPA
jgi:hypothetical protein